MTRSTPLPLAPPPYPAEALHSWLHRVAATYSMKPRQLLHALGVQRFAGPIFTHPKGAIQSALEPRDIRGLAHLARCDASQLGLTSTSLSDWLLVCDDWLIACPRCIRANLQSGMPPYERAIWRLATRSFCPRHRTPLTPVHKLPGDDAECDRLVPRLTDMEKVVAEDLIDFERVIARDHRGIAPPTLQQWLTATEFLQVLPDLTTFAVERWHVDGFRTASTLEQQAPMLVQHGPTLFRCYARKRSWYLDSGRHVSLAHISDPAIRRAVMWLAMEVIQLPPSPRPQHALRLGFTAQDAFVGTVKHEGWGWLAHQAQAWPVPYRSHYWARFTAAKNITNFPIALHDDTVKGTDDRVKGSE